MQLSPRALSSGIQCAYGRGLTRPKTGGVSFTFGEDIVAQFLRKMDLDLVCRAHQVVEDGYEFFARRQLVTIFSAPNYCGEFDNAGGMMAVDETLMCSFQILKPAEKAKRQAIAGVAQRPATPPARKP